MGIRVKGRAGEDEEEEEKVKEQIGLMSVLFMV